MRIKSKWHDSSIKSVQDIATALSFNTWRLTKNSLEDLINEGFVVEKAQVFDVIAEYACFIIQCTDRLIFDKLSSEKRRELIVNLVKQIAFYYQENKAERIKDGDHWQEFLNIYNQRAQDYSKFGFQNNAPDYHFYRYFGEQIKQATTKADEKWIAQQMIEIQGPKAFLTLKKNLDNTLGAVLSISDDKPEKPPTTREIRRTKRREDKGMSKDIDINERISSLY